MTNLDRAKEAIDLARQHGLADSEIAQITWNCWLKGKDAHSFRSELARACGRLRG